MLDKFKTTFKEESEELLSRIEESFLELEKNPTDLEQINSVFRAVHTIKGSAAMFGFDNISKLAHSFESLMDEIRNGRQSIDEGIIDLGLRVRDHIRALLAIDGEPGPELAAVSEALIVAFGELGESQLKRGEPVKTASSHGFGRGEERTFRIYFKPNTNIFHTGTNVKKLVEELTALGECAIFPNTDAIPRLAQLDPESSYICWDIIITTRHPEQDLHEVFTFVEDRAQIRIEPVPACNLSDDGTTEKRLGEILVERGLVTTDTVRQMLKSQKRLGQALVERNFVTANQVDSALVEQQHYRKLSERKAETSLQTSSVRVASDKLDELVDLVGELVTLEARLSRTAGAIVHQELGSIAEQFGRLVARLRDETMGIRMLPIGSTFSKFKRLTRDLSLELGKDVELVTSGEETELDKTVIERLGDPLVHIIRNSLDHGIERPDVRIAAGKRGRGTISLSASHSGAHVLVRIADDGAGIDVDAVKAQALNRGIISSEGILSESEAFDLIFQPGFSTATKVSSVSGRGVGMDVVKREIDSLGGMVLVESTRGRGTAITLKIPLTLAIIPGLLVAIGPERYVVPLSAVDGCLEIPTKNLVTDGGHRMLSYRGDLLPYVDLRRFFGIDGNRPTVSQIVAAGSSGSRVGLVVDEILGECQSVVKPLGRLYRDVEGLSGATILGDGMVALILDIDRIARNARMESARAQRAS